MPALLGIRMDNHSRRGPEKNSGSGVAEIRGKLKNTPIVREVPPANKPYCEVAVEIGAGHILVIWRDESAREVERRAARGTLVEVKGELREQGWETIRDGPRTRIAVIAEETRFPDSPPQKDVP